MTHSLLHHYRYYTIIISLLQKGNQVMMITLLLVMQRACLWYYTIITYYYVIITQGSIITHYYLLQSAELADDLGLGFRGHIKKKLKPTLKLASICPFVIIEEQPWSYCSRPCACPTSAWVKLLSSCPGEFLCKQYNFLLFL